jgi:hypothetical protein
VAENECASLDFRASVDPIAPRDWCESIKDIVAMSNSGGGLILIGVNDDGSPSQANLRPVMALDPDLICVYFCHASDVTEAPSAKERQAANRLLKWALGLCRIHRLSLDVAEVFIDATELV